MARLKSELEVTCPCCQSTLVIDTNLGRVVSHKEPERGDKPELTEAQRILAEQAARREAIFQQSVDAEKTRGDALSKRFEEALRQARSHLPAIGGIGEDARRRAVEAFRGSPASSARRTGQQAAAGLRSRLKAILTFGHLVIWSSGHLVIE